MLAVLFLISCQVLADDDLNNNSTLIKVTEPNIVFDNRDNQFMVDVYTSPERLSHQKLASVDGKQRSGKIEFQPQPQGFLFYPRYYFTVEDMVFFYDAESVQYIIPDAGTTTIPLIPLLESVDENKPLSSAIYFSIRNSGTSLLRLASDNIVINPMDGKEGVNPGTAAIFKDAAISPGSTDRYRLFSVAGSIPLPSDLILAGGHIYFLEYNGSAVNLECAPVPISLNSVGQSQNRVSIPGVDLVAKLEWFSAHAQSGRSYFIEVTKNESIAPHTFYLNGRNNITLILTGNDDQNVIEPTSNGSLFTLGTGLSLVIDGNITLRGRNANNAALVQVNASTAFTMNQGAIISGNTNSGGSGGGVNLSSGGTFTMNGGTVLGNTALRGGGVYMDGGTFIMHDGEISQNTASSSSTDANGGGVYIGGGAFNMNRGKVYGNRALSHSSNPRYPSYSYGGGVYIHGGTFTMHGGEISINTASSNTAFFPSYASAYGGGVYVWGGIFTIRGGEIIGNTASISYSSSGTQAHGGGVYVRDNATFRISDGSIYGDNAAAELRNIANTGSVLFGAAQSGHFNADGAFIRLAELSRRDNTILVVNGALR